MGRKRSNRTRRVTNSNAISQMPRSFALNPVRYTQALNPLQQYEDRRRWHPEGPFAPARSFSQTRHRLALTPNIQKTGSHRLPNLFQNKSYKVAFEMPQKTLICVRRKIREQVLHALKKTGRKGQKSPKFNFFSTISCKRK